MIKLYEFLASWLRTPSEDDDRGASLVEYALLVALIAIVCVVAVTVLGEATSESFSETASGLN